MSEGHRKLCLRGEVGRMLGCVGGAGHTRVSYSVVWFSMSLLLWWVSIMFAHCVSSTLVFSHESLLL